MTTAPSGASGPAPAGDGAVLQWINHLGGPQLVEHMIADFLREAPRRIAAARAGLEQGDLSAVHRTMQRLKSSSGQLGAPAVRELSARLEQGTDLHAMLGWLDQLSVEVDRYVAWLGNLAKRKTT